MTPLAYRASPDGGQVLTLRRPGRAGLVARCLTLWRTRQLRQLQRKPLQHALPWMAASGVIMPAVYGRGSRGWRS